MAGLQLLIICSLSLIGAEVCDCDADRTAIGLQRLGGINTRMLYSSAHRGKQQNVAFRRADLIGESYIRPARSFPIDFAPVSSPSSFLPSSCVSEQIHITLGDQRGSCIVSFANANLGTSTYVEYSSTMEALLEKHTESIVTVYGSATAYSQLMDVDPYVVYPPMGTRTVTEEYIRQLEDTSKWAFDKKTGELFSNWENVTQATGGPGWSANPYMFYESPVLHTVVLSGLMPRTDYYYRVSGSCTIYRLRLPPESDAFIATASTENNELSVLSKVASGATLAEAGAAAAAAGLSVLYPITFGVTADLGQTQVSNMSVDALMALEPDVVLLVGDLSYADGWGSRWDSFGRMIERLASAVPMLTTGGNHEITSSQAWIGYMHRYPTPHKISNSPNFCYWGREIGPVNLIALCSYAGQFTSSLQYSWLTTYLDTRLNRTRTPWLVVMMHAPWYSTNEAHYREADLMRQAMESVLFEFGVDLVISGHVHAYERTKPIFDQEEHPCGSVYVVVGDGGNYEGAKVPWRRNSSNNKSISWSAFRESSFGVAGLTILDSSTANWSWHRHACMSANGRAPAYHMNFSAESCATLGDDSDMAMETSDHVVFVRPSAAQCPNRHASSPHLAPLASPAASPQAATDPPSSLSTACAFSAELLVPLIILVILSLMFNVALAYQLLCVKPHGEYARATSNSAEQKTSGNEGTGRGAGKGAAYSRELSLRIPITNGRSLSPTDEPFSSSIKNPMSLSLDSEAGDGSGVFFSRGGFGVSNSSGTGAAGGEWGSGGAGTPLSMYYRLASRSESGDFSAIGGSMDGGGGGGGFNSPTIELAARKSSTGSIAGTEAGISSMSRVSAKITYDVITEEEEDMWD